jgi:hypothetical protein
VRLCVAGKCLPATTTRHSARSRPNARHGHHVRQARPPRPRQGPRPDEGVCAGAKTSCERELPTERERENHPHTERSRNLEPPHVCGTNTTVSRPGRAGGHTSTARAFADRRVPPWLVLALLSTPLALAPALQPLPAVGLLAMVWRKVFLKFFTTEFLTRWVLVPSRHADRATEA